MSRAPRLDVGGVIYHLLNRANGKKKIFLHPKDYGAFENVLQEAVERFGMKVYAYCIMPNHWHLVVEPNSDGDLSLFTGWLTLTHTQRWHSFHHTVGFGHLYQGRYKSFPVSNDEY